MAFNGDFSVSQGLDVTSFSLQDVSTGSDPNLTGRTINLYKTDNSLLGGISINWPLSAGSIFAINGLLTRDYSLNILVTWQSSSPLPPPSSYSKNHIVTFIGNSNAFAYGLLQQIAANQSITSDNGFLYNLALVNSDIQNAGRANSYADQGNAQACLDRIYAYIINQNFYF